MEALHTKRVCVLMVKDIVTVQPETPVEDAARLLYTHYIGCLPVLEDDRLVGILTETDIFRAFGELFAARTPSQRLEVQMRNRPGELARVVRLIGIEKRINIARMVVPPLKVGEDSVAIMHLQVDEPWEIARAAQGRLPRRHAISRERSRRRLRPDRRIRSDAAPRPAVLSRAMAEL